MLTTVHQNQDFVIQKITKPNGKVIWQSFEVLDGKLMNRLEHTSLVGAKICHGLPVPNRAPSRSKAEAARRKAEKSMRDKALRASMKTRQGK